MSTFDGIIREFPDIRVDFFRSNGASPPLACFLSHIHSDHLAGLESLRSPFVFCSAATRELLLRLERRPCRINFAKGLMERRVQTYRHLRTLLKPLPLEAPAVIELSLGRNLGVTLLDANHCPGSVMFLFEGDGKAVLYTGDIRSEPWHVNSIARSPCMLPYSAGIKTIDRIYLDTSNTEDVDFPPKDSGLRELLQKVARYPTDTIFYFSAWTFGYEKVWVALSKALGSPVHVDDYRLQLYKSLVVKGDPENQDAMPSYGDPEAAALVGFICGNTAHPGCLSRDSSVRLHSCEKENLCTTVRKAEAARTLVYIEPIVTRLAGDREVAEAGTGGGGGNDLAKELELVRFPFSRHSSYPELCHLVDTFKPRDVWPCTFHMHEWNNCGLTMKGLFGAHCSGSFFEHDEMVSRLSLAEQTDMDAESQRTMATQRSDDMGYTEHERGASSSLDDRLGGKLLQRPLQNSQAADTPAGASSRSEQLCEAHYARFKDTGAEADSDFMSQANLEFNTKKTCPEDECLQGPQNPATFSSLCAPSVLGDELEYKVQHGLHDMLLSEVARRIFRRAGSGISLGLISTTENHSRMEVELGSSRLTRGHLNGT